MRPVFSPDFRHGKRNVGRKSLDMGRSAQCYDNNNRKRTVMGNRGPVSVSEAAPRLKIACSRAGWNDTAPESCAERC